MVGHDADPSDDPLVQHSPYPLHGLLGRKAEGGGDGVIGTRAQRQPLLRRLDDAAIDLVDPGAGRDPVHASNLRPTKNSSIFGML